MSVVGKQKVWADQQGTLVTYLVAARYTRCFTKIVGNR